MNVDDNHLVSGPELDRIRKGLGKAAADRYTPLPPALEGAARKVLQGRRAVKIARNSGGRISQWAARERRTAAKEEKEHRRSRQQIEKKTKAQQAAARRR